LYADANPVRGNVPPIVIFVFVTPGVLVCEAAAALAAAAVASSTQSRAPSFLRLTAMRPPAIDGVRRDESSTEFDGV
jgi:hypothetical protein